MSKAMIRVYARLIIAGRKTIDDVPEASRTGIHRRPRRGERRVNPIAQQLVIWATTGIITALGGYMLGWWRGYRRKSDAMQTGVRVLLLCKLEQMQREMVANDGIADNTAKQTAQLVYDSYHSLGGNGHGTQVNQDIQDAPIAPKKV